MSSSSNTGRKQRAPPHRIALLCLVTLVTPMRCNANLFVRLPARARATSQTHGSKDECRPRIRALAGLHKRSKLDKTRGCGPQHVLYLAIGWAASRTSACHRGCIWEQLQGSLEEIDYTGRP